MTQVTDADWLEEAAIYFEKRPTGGEDMAFWANTANAERCRSIAAALLKPLADLTDSERQRMEECDRREADAYRLFIENMRAAQEGK